MNLKLLLVLLLAVCILAEDAKSSPSIGKTTESEEKKKDEHEYYEDDREKEHVDSDHFRVEFPSHIELKRKLRYIVHESNGGFGFNMWACIVNRDGLVEEVTFSGADRGSQWPASRQIACQKANTANSLSLANFALSTANLYFATQPGGTLFGLQEANPLNHEAAYAGPSDQYGQEDDPWVKKKAGGCNVFGGGLALYDKHGRLIGGLGLSGDSSCTDHIIAWKLRSHLNLDNVPDGPVGKTDNMVNDLSYTSGVLGSTSGWGHPTCSASATSIVANLTLYYPVGPADYVK